MKQKLTKLKEAKDNGTVIDIDLKIPLSKIDINITTRQKSTQK